MSYDRVGVLIELDALYDHPVVDASSRRHTLTVSTPLASHGLQAFDSPET